jgi:hypothetical protein
MKVTKRATLGWYICCLFEEKKYLNIKSSNLSCSIVNRSNNFMLSECGRLVFGDGCQICSESLKQCMFAVIGLYI